jgi:23S rRNA (adenine2503-C2)-methyltransferase
LELQKSMTEREDILGKTQTEIGQIIETLKLPRYAVLQVTDWLYKKGVCSFDEMTNLTKEDRKRLDESFYIGRQKPSDVQISSDGTRKYLFPVKGGKYIESVYIPEPERSTLCLSSQVGCKMGCVFCMTGKQGFQGNLTSGEIVNQIVSLPEQSALTNYVFMGMGEPLANTENVLKSIEILTADYAYGISPSRITVSTIGMLPGLKQMIEQSNCHLAISLHSPFEDERLSLMPVEKLYPVRRVIEFLKMNPIGRQRRISFEYIMFSGINDTARHVNGLARLLNGLRCRINLIRYHPIPGVEFASSNEETLQWFKKRLNEKGILTTIRASRGQDIFAACGMLSTYHRDAALKSPASHDIP